MSRELPKSCVRSVPRPWATNRSKRSANDSWAISDKPRDRNAFIIDGGMKRMILVTGGVFFLLLLGFVYVCEHADVTSLTDLCNLQFGTGMGLSALEKSYIFTFFVMLQFWNMFNARLSHGTIGLPHQPKLPLFRRKEGEFFVGSTLFCVKGGKGVRSGGRPRCKVGD